MTPHFDFHALAPEIILSATIVIVLIADLLFADRESWQSPRIATIGVLAALVPVITLAIDGNNRVMFGGAYVVDPYALTFKALFLVAAYISLLLSVDYIGEGDYYQGEFYFLLLTSVLGMIVMASARDLITIFVALEAISIPTFVLAGWRKHDTKSNEASIKYYLIGVLSSAVMLYGMSFIFGFSGSTLLTDISRFARRHARCRAAVRRRHLPHPGRVRVQDQRGAVPLLGARHLRGRSHTGHRVPVGLVEGGWLRRPAHGRLRRVLPEHRLVAAGALGARRAVDDGREPRRAAPDQHRPDARLLVGRTGWLHPRSARGGPERRPRLPSRRWSPTCSSTRR